MTSADDPTASLEQQLDITLKGKEQRLMLMQKLMRRKPESKVIKTYMLFFFLNGTNLD